MSRSIFLRRAARRDIGKHADYLGRSNRAASLRFFSALDQALRKLVSMPEMGSLCDFASPELAGMRVWSIRGFDKHLIYYLHTTDRITVVRVLHGSQDVESIFGQEESGGNGAELSP